MSKYKNTASAPPVDAKPFIPKHLRVSRKEKLGEQEAKGTPATSAKQPVEQEQEGEFTMSPPTADADNKRYSLEPIADIKERASAWPDSAEKFATLLWASLAECMNPHKTTPPDDVFFSLLEDLQGRVEHETYLSLDQGLILNIRHEIKSRNWKEAFNLTSLVLSAVRPFNVHVTDYLIKQSRSYADEMRGQEVLVFLGRSGAGKSTTLLYLTGHDMIQRDNAYRDIGPVPGAAPEEFKVNGNPESETAYVRGIPITRTYLRSLRIRDSEAEGTVIALDTPGIGDNLGAEVDVANTIGIHIALKSCKAFWPVIILSQRDGNNFEQSKDSLTVAANIFRDIRTVKRTLSFLFTKFDKEDHDSIEATFQRLNDQAEEELPREDPYRNSLIAVEEVLEDLKGNEIVLPLEPSRIGKHLKHILKKTPIPPSSVSERPSLLASSENFMDRQLQLNMACMRFALANDELDLVVQRLKEMELLAGLVSSSRVARSVADAREVVLDFLTSKYKAVTERIREFKDPATGAIAVDVLSTLDSVASSAEFLQKKLPDLDLATVTSETTSNALASLTTTLKQGAIDSQVLSLNERLNQLNKLRVLCERVPSVDPSIYLQATSAIATQVRDLQHLATKMLQDRKLGGAGEVASRALSMARHFSAHLTATSNGDIFGIECEAAATGSGAISTTGTTSSRSTSDSSLISEGELQEQGQGDSASVPLGIGQTAVTHRHLNAWRQAFVETLLSVIQEPVHVACRALTPPGTASVEARSDDTVATVRTALELLKDVRHHYQLTGVLGPEAVQAFEAMLANACDSYLAGICDAIKATCEEDSVAHALNLLRPPVLRLLEFKDLPSFQVSRLFAEYEQRARQNVSDLVHTAQRRVRDIVQNTFFDDQDQRNTAALPALLAALRGANFVDELQPGTLNRTLDSVIDDIKNEAYQFYAVVTRMPIQPDNLDILPDVAEAVDKLSNLRALGTVLEDINEHFEKAKQHVEEGVNRVFNKAEALFRDIPGQGGPSVEEGDRASPLVLDFTLSLRRVYRIEQFVNACRQCHLANHVTRINELKTFLEESMAQYGSYIRKCLSHITHNVLTPFVEDAERDGTAATQRLRSVSLALQVRLDEYKRMERSYPSLYEAAFEAPQTELFSLQGDARTRETECQALLAQGMLSKLGWHVAAAGILQQVDHVLNPEQGHMKYNDVYQRYASTAMREADRTEADIRDALVKKEFAQVAALFKDLKSTTPREPLNLRQAILSAVDAVYDQCLSMAKRLSFAEPGDFQGTFEDLNQALKTVNASKALGGDDLGLIDRAKAEDLRAKQAVIHGSVLGFLEDRCGAIERRIEHCFFTNADKDLTHLERCLPLLPATLEKLPEMRQRMNGLRDKIDKGPEEKLACLVEMPFEELCRSPPQILKRLSGEGDSVQSIAHGPLLHILNKYRDQLENDEDVARIDADTVTRFVHRYKSHLPPGMHSEVEEVLRDILAMLRQKAQQRSSYLEELLEKRDFVTLRKEVQAIKQQSSPSAAGMQERLVNNTQQLLQRGLDACQARVPEFLDIVGLLSKCSEIDVPNASAALAKAIQAAQERLHYLFTRARDLFSNPKPTTKASGQFGMHPEDEGEREFTRAVIQCLYLEKAIDTGSSLSPSSSGSSLHLSHDNDRAQMLSTVRYMEQFCKKRVNELEKQGLEIAAAIKSLQAGKVTRMSVDNSPVVLGHQCRALAALGNELGRSPVREDLAVAESLVTACAELKAKFASIMTKLEKKITTLVEQCLETNLLDDRFNVNTEEREKAYTRIHLTMKLLDLMQPFSAELFQQGASSHRKQELEAHMAGQRERLAHEVKSATDAGKWDRCDMLMSHLNMLGRVPTEKEASSCEAAADQSQSMHEVFRSKADALMQRLRASAGLDQIAEYLIELQKMADGLDCVRDHITARVSDFLSSLDRKSNRNIPELGLQLEQKQSPHATRVLQEHSVFTGYLRRLFNNRISAVSMDDALDALRKTTVNGLDEAHVAELKEAYQQYKSKYEESLQLLTEGRKGVSMLANRVQNMTADFETDVSLHSGGMEWSHGMRHKLPRLVADIFAMWTLHNASNPRQKRDELLQPHPAQILSIFRLLGIGTAQLRPHPHLVQVLTGQGKSVVLGVLSSVLALYGMHVSVACYSEYLSERDHRDFSFLFDKLGIAKRVEYGTFNQLCERHINAKGDVRSVVKHLLEKDEFPSAGVLTRIATGFRKVRDALASDSSASNTPRVLLIDEVDVALDPTILSNTYAPNCQVTHDALQKLMLWMWSNRHTRITTAKVKQTQEYVLLQRAFHEQFHPLLESCTNALLQDLQTFEDHDYVFENGCIGYKLHDSVSYKMRMRYKTVFALMHELEKQGVSVTTSDAVGKELCFLLNCGEFSYFQVQKTFDLVLGVTGTLQELSEPELKVLREDYGIESRTVMPSMFGASQLKPFEAQDLQVVGQEHFLLTVSQEVRRRYVQDRPVLVVFETDRQLQEYLNHDSVQSMMGNVQVLSEKLSSSEKEKIVRKATQQKRITLCTRSFGRGVDFQVRDPAVVEKGGMHVLQTFLAETMAEERQIMGRTARQGEKGSYSVVLCKEHLEGFGVQPDNVEGHETVEALREFLRKKRDEAFAKKFAQNYDIAKAVKENHDTSMTFLDNLRKGQKGEVVQQLEKWNYTRQAVQMATATRTLWALDCTYSMATSLAKTTQVIGIVFERIEQILKDANLLDNSDVALQLVAFRNYNTIADQLLQASPWEQNPMSLRQFLSGLSVNGGWGNEAIEVALARANSEKDVSQVILIGDAPANTPAEVVFKRNERGEKYWRRFPAFAQATTAEAELQQLQAKRIPVHCFYIKDRAKTFFEHAASMTGGRCEKLRIESKKGAEQLTNLVSEEMLRRVGGDDLVDTYRATYCQ